MALTLPIVVLSMALMLPAGTDPPKGGDEEPPQQATRQTHAATASSGTGVLLTETLIATDERVFTGAPISLSIKDADLKDVIRTFAQLTELNFVVHPSVSGRVTVELHQVPWDQALDLILNLNGLGWQLEGNVVVIAPRDQLQQMYQAATDE